MSQTPSVSQMEILSHIGTLYTLKEMESARANAEMERAGKLFDLLFQVASGAIKPGQLWCNLPARIFEVRELPVENPIEPKKEESGDVPPAISPKKE
jgi:hypothetical protein